MDFLVLKLGTRVGAIYTQSNKGKRSNAVVRENWVMFTHDCMQKVICRI